MFGRRPLDQASDEDFYRVIGLNTHAAFAIRRAAAPVMCSDGHGSMIQTTSIAARTGGGGGGGPIRCSQGFCQHHEPSARGPEPCCAPPTSRICSTACAGPSYKRAAMGVLPGEHSSEGKKSRGAITKTGNGHVRQHGRMLTLRARPPRCSAVPSMPQRSFKRSPEWRKNACAGVTKCWGTEAD